MRKRKLGLVILIVAFLFCSCASSSPYGKNHRSKRKCNCPTFSFFSLPDNERTLHIATA